MTLEQELLDGLQCRPTGHAIVGQIEKAVRLQPLANDGNEGVLSLR